MNKYLLNILINIQNGQIAKRCFIVCPRKKNSEVFLKILWDEGFILGYQICYKNSNKLKIFLKYKNNQAVIQTIKIISKSGGRIFYSINNIWKIKKLFIIISTKKNLKWLHECKKCRIGGEAFSLIN